MKFLETRKETQVVLMAGALAGVIEAFGRDDEDEGKKLIVTALHQVGLTFDEFRKMMTEVSPEVEAEINAVTDAVIDSDIDFDDPQPVCCSECDSPVGDCDCEQEDEDLDTMEERPGNRNEDGQTDENGWSKE
ncbi:hypothetical protein pEaSNUABM30_00309 [Erwinia phage pEa_SNUABM_30]|uniref:Uncharacterized protein n=1 Tax=Erwinia phage pEa_SNUABM_30 TaxID=2869553 RepID=A0AAE8XMA5_9CAUD|nr:hypothetical protein MPK69_gp309 [Erwinia phage pEa_SNUABM_30]UAW53427.1 hypothetical protein pEaSNUABM30_00309 [Erwinia phage pEa_SNUABM_30]